MKVLYVSFYTPNYQGYARELIGCLRRLSLDHDVREVKCKGGFLQNVRFKPLFILQMMQEHKDAERIVWVDSDALINRTPRLFEQITEDLAAYFMPPRPNRAKKEHELLSGTMCLRNTPKVRKMMKRWLEALDDPKTKHLLKPEQQVLQKILPKLGVSVYRLPKDYCWIVRAGDGGIPTIEHHQASRVSRHLPSGGRVPVHRMRRRVDRHGKPIPHHGRRRPRARKGPGQRVSYRRSQPMMPYGGVKGQRVSPSDEARMKVDAEKMPHAVALDGSHVGATVVVAGSGASRKELGPSLLKRHLLISECVEVDTVPVDYIFLSSRETYWDLMQSGELPRISKTKASIIVARHVFDPTFKLEGPYEDLSKRAQPVPDFECAIYDGVIRKTGVVNIETFAKPIPNYGSSHLALIQAAVILGAQRLYLAGLELGTKVTEDISLKGMREVAKAIKYRKVEVVNLCANPDDVLCKVFQQEVT